MEYIVYRPVTFAERKQGIHLPVEIGRASRLDRARKIAQAWLDDKPPGRWRAYVFDARKRRADGTPDLGDWTEVLRREDGEG